jgi:hypothetical protein
MAKGVAPADGGGKRDSISVDTKRKLHFVPPEHSEEKQYHFRSNVAEEHSTKFSPNMGMMVKWDLVMCAVLIYTAFAT